MLTIELVDTNAAEQVNRFVDLPYRLYADVPNWLPPIRALQVDYLDRQTNPFYTHSEADFFLATRAGHDVGRIAVLAHAPGHELYNYGSAHFYLFECEDDPEAAAALFAQATDWATQRGYPVMMGPMGFSILDSLALLIDGFDQPQVTTMSAYHHPYYASLIEANGFGTYEERASFALDGRALQLPKWVIELADTVRHKGALTPRRLQNVAELYQLAPRLIHLLAANVGSIITDDEIAYLLRQLLPMINPHFIHYIQRAPPSPTSPRTRQATDQAIVAGLLAFPDCSAALRAAPGFPTPAAIQTAIEQTQRIIFNGIFIDPSYQIMGLSALLIGTLAQTVQANKLQAAYFVHVAGPGGRMAHDLTLIGAKPVHHYRMYVRELA